MADAEGRTWQPLSPKERRVAGVLIEKQKTTPDYYPMTLAALVAGCNQKSNREPATNYDSDEVEDTLHDLRRKGAAVLYEGSGRVERWKHLMYDWLGLRDRPVEMAIVAELLLRGPQTVGDLRGRAGRMIREAEQPDLPALNAMLEALAARGLVVFLSPPGQRRGVVVTHGLYPPEELERLRQAYAGRDWGSEDGEGPAPAAPAARGPARDEAVEAMRAELAALRQTVEALSEEVAALKAALGV